MQPEFRTRVWYVWNVTVIAGDHRAMKLVTGSTDSLDVRYGRDGFVTVMNLLAAEELQRLKRRISEVARGVVNTLPASKIEFEPASHAASGETGIRKINECAERDAVFMAHAANPRILDIVELLIGADIKLYGSQCFMKPPGGIEKPYHQDSAYFTIEPTDLVTCWTALDDATVANGCLYVIPGSHRGEILDHDEPWLVGDREDMQVRRDQYDASGEVAIELQAGSVSFHHSRLLHRSGPNRTDSPRRGLAVHYMSAKSRWTHPTKPKPPYVLLRGREYDGCV
ncbi:MAG: phytanoyl-CoA dioxygenase family protein [Planctomycetaceae bacterium]|nr:phytanoyl-CoA dioxygenase family protein [Planctomycetales bacterium]MCB9922634.1 phytanoyl-CoA dioxygenase family protein [Planctomycetaceae bacterium]